MILFSLVLLMGLGAAQGLIMAVDEFHFHRKRGLQRFERWGHVADTALFLLALLVPLVMAPTATGLGLFAFLSLASCLLITKDEWIHAAACTGAEQWCHALLFILHGPVLIATGLLWFLAPDHAALKALPPLVFMWGLYQHLYWNVYHERKHTESGREQRLLRRSGRTMV